MANSQTPRAPLSGERPEKVQRSQPRGRGGDPGALGVDGWLSDFGYFEGA